MRVQNKDMENEINMFISNYILYFLEYFTIKISEFIIFPRLIDIYIFLFFLDLLLGLVNNLEIIENF